MGLISGYVLNGLKNLALNPLLKGIGVVHSLDVRHGRLHVTASLDGLDGVPVEITCHTFIVSADGRSVTLAGFQSNLAFVQNALNRFAAGTHHMPPNPLARKALAAAGRIIG